MAKTILTVDDSATLRQMIAFTLQSAGFQTVEAVDGQDALDKAAEGGFDLVITDVNMPRMDGITLVRRLRALPAFRFTPILILTTEASPEMKLRGRESGATGWIVKPFSPEQLVDVVNKVL